MQVLILKRRHYNEVKMSMATALLSLLKGLREKRRKINVALFISSFKIQRETLKVTTNTKYYCICKI